MAKPNRHLIARVANRLKREILRIPPVKAFRDRDYQQQLAAHRPQLPALLPEHKVILEGVEARGVHETTLDAFANTLSAQVQQDLMTLLPELQALPSDGDNAPRLPVRRIYDFPSIYLWGLEERMLALVENYVGLPIWYHGADLRKEVADGKLTDVRQWHVDAEDRRMFKVIMYLNDVTPKGGPFEYVDRGDTQDACQALGYHTGFVRDDRMEGALPRSKWRAAVGPKWTAVAADTCAVFHRATPPVGTDRYSVTWSWTSQIPVKTYVSVPFPDDLKQSYMQKMTPRQRACLRAV